MDEYPKMLYHLTKGERVVQDFDEEQSLGDEWMSYAELRAAQDAPPKRRPGRPRQSEEPEAEVDEA